MIKPEEIKLQTITAVINRTKDISVVVKLIDKCLKDNTYRQYHTITQILSEWRSMYKFILKCEEKDTKKNDEKEIIK